MLVLFDWVILNHKEPFDDVDQGLLLVDFSNNEANKHGKQGELTSQLTNYVVCFHNLTTLNDLVFRQEEVSSEVPIEIFFFKGQTVLSHDVLCPILGLTFPPWKLSKVQVVIDFSFGEGVPSVDGVCHVVDSDEIVVV